METILIRLCTREYIFYISGSDNYRYKVNPEYKANRKDTEDPVHREPLKLYAMSKWNAVLVHGMEADDALAIEQLRTDPMVEHPETIIVTIDKDLNMVEGYHYNFVKDIIFVVNPTEAIKFFWEQLLIGDKADNIIGIKGIGAVKAERALRGCADEDEMFEVVRSMYNDDERLATNARCLWMSRREPDDWTTSDYYKELCGTI